MKRAKRTFPGGKVISLPQGVPYLSRNATGSFETSFGRVANGTEYITYSEIQSQKEGQTKDEVKAGDEVAPKNNHRQSPSRLPY